MAVENVKNKRKVRTILSEDVKDRIKRWIQLSISFEE